jgi:hypothetical protein
VVVTIRTFQSSPFIIPAFPPERSAGMAGEAQRECRRHGRGSTLPTASSPRCACFRPRFASALQNIPRDQAGNDEMAVRGSGMAALAVEGDDRRRRLVLGGACRARSPRSLLWRRRPRRPPTQRQIPGRGIGAKGHRPATRNLRRPIRRCCAPTTREHPRAPASTREHPRAPASTRRSELDPCRWSRLVREPRSGNRALRAWSSPPCTRRAPGSCGVTPGHLDRLVTDGIAGAPDVLSTRPAPRRVITAGPW